ncbi:MAG: hypothetical protein FWD78_01540 [Treponema sp.]|nr:hypothetical protein [Treponema sp.]
MKKAMTSRERVENTLRLDTPDRVPVNYATNPAVHGRLAKHLGFDENEYEGVLRALGVDIRAVQPAYRGPDLFKQIPDRKVNQVYGYVTRWVPNEHGGYWDFCDFPMTGMSAEQIAAFPVPNPDNFDYDLAVQQAKAFAKENLAIQIGTAGFADIINATGRVMGMEDTLVNLLAEDEATLAYIDRRNSMEIGILERLISRIGNIVSLVLIGEDLGTQRSPMISLDMYRRVLRPRHQRYADFAKSFNKPLMVHTCGCSSWVYEDFIEMGVSAVDTLQPEAVGMAPSVLKKQFGGRLAFSGCISTAGPLAYGTAEDTRAVVRETLDIMMPGGGYVLAPTHQIQDNTPVENILAMYETAHSYGVYNGVCK